MKNFFGRLIILIDTLINCALGLIAIGSLLFFAIGETKSMEIFFSGQAEILSYVGFSILFVDFVTFVTITIICLIDIINGRSMKHALIGSIILFIINLTCLLFNLYIPHEDTVYFDLFIGLTSTIACTTLLQILGSWFNYSKDCR